MNNSQISHGIKRLANMMILLDENPFKIKAFEKAAGIVENHPEEMGVLIDEDRLKNEEGIGETLARIILYYAKSGGPVEEKELLDRLPLGLPELLELPGLGVIKVQQLWQELGISNLDTLYHACKEKQLSDVKGFGSKLQQKLLDSIDFRKKHSRDFHLDTALSVAQSWLDKLRALQCVKRIELTGELRRRNNLIQSVEFLVDAESSVLAEILNAQFSLELCIGDTIEFDDISTLPVHIYFSVGESFGANQLTLTGGDVFLGHLDLACAKEGVTRSLDQFTNLNTTNASENEICQSLSIQWIEPELRDAFDHFPEDRKLIEPGDVKGVFHAHSTWSDGRNSLDEMVNEAHRLGYEYFGITEHSQAAYYANGLKPDRVHAQWERIDELNDRYTDFHIFKGIEADILVDGSLDYDEELLAGFDFVIASIHSHFHLNPVQQTDRIIRALHSPYTTMLGHPTGRMLLARAGYAPDLETIIEVAGEQRKIIEINTTPKRLDLDWRHLDLARDRGVKISINPDAHSVKALSTIPLGVMMARKGGLSADDVVNTMKLEDMKTYLQLRRNA